MTREEAQRQLTALAQAVRAGHVLKSDDYPVLSLETHAGISLWHLSAARAVAEHWSDHHTADWYEHEAINELRLDRH